MTEIPKQDDFDPIAFGARLAEAIFPEKPSLFASRIGLPHTTVSKYIRGQVAGPQLDVVARMAEGLGESLDWLVFGRGQGKVAGEVVRVPRFDATLAAGAGSWNEGKRRLDDMPFTPAFFQKKLGRSSGAGFAVLEARGDSMAPKIADGDLLLIDEGDTRITDGIFAFLLDDEARVKRIRRKLGGVSIISDNPDYETEEVPSDQLDRLTVIGRVRWVGSVVG